MRRPTLTSFRNVLRRFVAAPDANVASMFALALVPMVGLVGAAVDYGRANAARTEMQSALDSAALMLSKEVENLTPAQLKTKALDYFRALAPKLLATDVVVTPTYTNDTGFKLVLTGTATVHNDFMAVLGNNAIKIEALSQVTWGNSRLRVALVLDNTGSMKDAGKMDALKTATKNLLNQLKAAATKPEDVYVSIIPFAKDVNVGEANYNAAWVDFTAWKTVNGKCSKKSNKTQADCADAGGNWTPANQNTWTGCVTDRGPSAAPNAQNWDRKVDAPILGNTDSLYPAEQYSDCPQTLMSLNSDWSAMTTLVNNMTPAGATNQPIGLVWGWLSLAGKSPLTAPTKDPKFTYQDIIILLSDGLNTQDRWYGNGATQSPSVDRRMIEPSDGSGTCANIKSAGVTIYAVQVNTGGDPTSTLLQQCASDSSKFFLLTSANQMITTFQKIGANLTQLRLAK